MTLTQIMADKICFLVLYISTYINVKTHLTLYYTYFCI